MSDNHVMDGLVLHEAMVKAAQAAHAHEKKHPQPHHIAIDIPPPPVHN